MVGAPARPAARPWRVLPLETGPAATLVATGAALLDGLAGDPVPTLRWYRATTTAIVLGRGQRDLASRAGTRASRAGAQPVEVLVRASGGGAVLMTPDLLSLDVLVPAGHRLLDGVPSAVFTRVGRAWAAGLAALGLGDLAVFEGPAQARRSGTERERLLAAVCYATLGRGEVTAGGRKVVGLAQRRRRAGALVQCGMLRRWRPEPLLAALGADPHDPEVAAAAVGLDDLGGRAPDDGAIIEAVSARFAGKDASDG